MGVLPSKKFLVVVLAALIVLGAWFLASYKSNSNNDNNSSGKFSYISSLFKSNDKDSDNDGLMDWEEALWKTDPNNPDTDGDGTLDGQEINLGRDPLKPGPDDKLETSSLISQKFSSGESSLTQDLSMQFFSEYLKQKQLGNLSEATKENLISSFMTNIQTGQTPDYKAYSVSDINISYDNSSGAIKKYGNDMGAIIKKDSGPATEHEIIIFQRAIETENENELQKLNEITDAYNKMSANGLLLQVPSNIANLHLSLINSFAGTANNLKNMQKIFTDPVLGGIGFEQYQKTASDMLETFRNINNFFTDKKVIFSTNEDGYVFKQIAEEL